MKLESSSFRRYRLHAVGFAVLGATLGAPALAQWSDWSQNAYIGGNLGATKNHLSGEPDFFLPLPPGAPIPLFSTGRDNTDKGGKAYLGYQFHPNVAVEGGYFQLGRFTWTESDLLLPPGTIRGRSRYRGLNVDLVGIAPLGDFAIFGRIGAAYTDARTRIRTAGTFDGGGVVKERAWGPKIGIGLEYNITPQFAVRGELERYRVKDEVRGRGNVDMASLGLVYRFGGPAPEPTRVVAPPPPPPPAMAPPPPAPAPMAPPPPPPAPAPLPPRPYRN